MRQIDQLLVSSITSHTNLQKKRAFQKACIFAALLLRERRIWITTSREWKIETRMEQDYLSLDELPRSTSFSGWMRNDREEHEYLYPNAK